MVLKKNSENMTTPVLEVMHARISYGAIEAVKGVTLKVFPNEMVALMGSNGAGKSTLLKAISGLLPLQSGSIFYQGRDITTVPVHERVGLGIALVPEGRGIFSRLSVLENLMMGTYLKAEKLETQHAMDRVFEWFPRIAERRQQLAGTLSGGEQQMLAMGRALIMRPQILLLDEPSMGLAPIVVEKIFEVIHSIGRDGVCVLLVEQNVELALSVCTRAYVMETGRVALSGSAEELREHPHIQQAYLGQFQESST